MNEFCGADWIVFFIGIPASVRGNDTELSAGMTLR